MKDLVVTTKLAALLLLVLSSKVSVAGERFPDLVRMLEVCNGSFQSEVHRLSLTEGEHRKLKAAFKRYLSYRAKVAFRISHPFLPGKVIKVNRAKYRVVRLFETFYHSSTYSVEDRTGNLLFLRHYYEPANYEGKEFEIVTENLNHVDRDAEEREKVALVQPGDVIPLDRGDAEVVVHLGARR